MNTILEGNKEIQREKWGQGKIRMGKRQDELVMNSAVTCHSVHFRFLRKTLWVPGMLFLSPLPASVTVLLRRPKVAPRWCWEMQVWTYLGYREKAWVRAADLTLTLGRAWPDPQPSVAMGTFSTALSWWMPVSSPSVPYTGSICRTWSTRMVVRFVQSRRSL